MTEAGLPNEGVLAMTFVRLPSPRGSNGGVLATTFASYFCFGLGLCRRSRDDVRKLLFFWSWPVPPLARHTPNALVSGTWHGFAAKLGWFTQVS